MTTERSTSVWGTAPPEGRRGRFAAYEDTLRRIARQHAGIIGQDKLENVIGKLKDARLLVAPQLGIASGYLSFRNHALHAQWETIDRAAVQSVLGFVEELLLKHFS